MPFTGFFVALASAGAPHGPWAQTTVTPAQPRSGTAATAMLSDFQNGLMTPPLVLLRARSNIVVSFRNNERHVTLLVRTRSSSYCVGPRSGEPRERGQDPVGTGQPR